MTSIGQTTSTIPYDLAEELSKYCTRRTKWSDDSCPIPYYCQPKYAVEYDESYMEGSCQFTGWFYFIVVMGTFLACGITFNCIKDLRKGPVTHEEALKTITSKVLEKEAYDKEHANPEDEKPKQEVCDWSRISPLD